ncbi:MAG: hypothetical protein V1721_03635 [Pseudomonadota bacterium]
MKDTLKEKHTKASDTEKGKGTEKKEVPFAEGKRKVMRETGPNHRY